MLLLAHLAAPSYWNACCCRRDSTKKRGEEGEEEGGAGLDFDALPPQAQAVELACRCDDVSDDGVELRLLKALLTAVTSTTLAVHGQALLLVVRACYNIFLTSRSDVNQATAKATLTQVGGVLDARVGGMLAQRFNQLLQLLESAYGSRLRSAELHKLSPMR